jgi:hypothetical protein
LVADLDPIRVETAKKMGCDLVFVPGSEEATSLTRGAARLVRDRVRIVVVGDVSLDLSRRLASEKELSVVLSRSYGPGRYDSLYKETGLDYPIGYVR